MLAVANEPAKHFNYPQKINFQHLLANEDLVLGEIQAIYQDSIGFIWLGSNNALVRYDGYDFKPINFIPQDAPPGDSGLPVKSITHIMEDRRGTLWIGGRGGLMKYNRNLGRLEKLKHQQDLQVQAYNASISFIVESKDGKIVGASSNGIFIVDPMTEHISNINQSNNNKLSHDSIHSLYFDETGNLWLGTESGFDKMDWQSQAITNYKAFPDKPDSVTDNTVMGFVPDKDGRFWLGTTNGLVNLDPATQTFTRYRHDKNDPHSLGGNVIWTLFKDTNGYLWIATDGGGLSVFDHQKEKFIRYQHDRGRSGSLSSNVVRSIFEDSSGDIWVGNFPEGLNFFDRSSAAITVFESDPSNPNSLNHRSVLGIQVDNKGNVWVGTDGGGLDYLNRDTEEFTHFTHDEDDPSSISSNAILTTFIDSQGVLWAGTWGGGIFHYNTKTKDFTRIPFDYKRTQKATIETSKRLNSANVWCVYEDRQKVLWVCTHSGGLSRYDRHTGEFTHYWPDDNDKHSIASGLVWTVFEDSQGEFWVGTVGGLSRLDRDTGKFTRYESLEDDPTTISHESILSFYEDSKGRLWIGSERGLNLYHRESDTFSGFFKKDGFIDDAIRSIIEDDAGLLWLGTNNGVSSFNPESRKVRNYNRDSGRTVGAFSIGAAAKSDQGEVIFGGVKGLRFFRTAELEGNKNIPPVVLTDFKIFSESVGVGGNDGILTKTINQSDNIVIDHTKSMFVFDFSALNYRDSGKNQYAYKLEGFDHNWIYVDDQRSAKYTNLDAGTYVFRVKGSNNDGLWNEAGNTITIVQLPPPWKTWWAYTLYSLAGIALVLAFVHHQSQKRRRIEEQNRLLEKKVKERTVELQKKNNDIQSMLGNMHQGLFTIEANGKIHPEYSHFMEDIFETKNIVGVHYADILFSQCDLTSDKLNQTKESVNAIVGEDPFNFDFNSHLLVEEYDKEIKGKTKHLSLDWSPIIQGDIVDKLMITVRDVTQLKQLQADAKHQQRELDMMMQLLNISSKKYFMFEKSSAKFIEQNREGIRAAQAPEPDTLALLFRNMHTIKGNSRTFGFTHVSTLAHDIESDYTALKNPFSHKEVKAWDKTLLLAQLDGLEQVLAEYADIYRRVLGRTDKEDRTDGMWLDADSMMTINDSINAMHKVFPEVVESKILQPIQSMMLEAISSPFEKVIEDIVQSLPSMAQQLGKAEPSVQVHAKGIHIKNESHALINNVFSHILRNSLDHGIEAPDQREQSGKQAEGHIEIEVKTERESLVLRVRDDGRGLNIDRLFEKGVETGLWERDAHPDCADIAELMFASGVSTKEAVTDISGRGVGMDAVRQFLVDQGGNIHLHLLAPKAANDAFVPFETVIDVPKSALL